MRKWRRWNGQFPAKDSNEVLLMISVLRELDEKESVSINAMKGGTNQNASKQTLKKKAFFFSFLSTFSTTDGLRITGHLSQISFLHSSLPFCVLWPSVRAAKGRAQIIGHPISSSSVRLPGRTVTQRSYPIVASKCAPLWPPTSQIYSPFHFKSDRSWLHDTMEPIKQCQKCIVTSFVAFVRFAVTGLLVFYSKSVIIIIIKSPAPRGALLIFPFA